MANAFHNRLVGTIVVVSLGVIFLPDMLDGKKQVKEDNFATIPLRPDYQHVEVPEGAFEPVAITAGSDTDPIADEKAVVEEVQRQANAQASATNEPSAQTKPNPPQSKPQETKPAALAYAVQVGSFSKAENVNALVAALRKEGLKAYTVPSKVVDGRLTKVMVGPNVSRAKLEKQQALIKKVAKVNSVIVRYDPLANQ
ncbi:SPOR domain-containing protein [Paraferrimonas sedimenticola]|uniref:Cell division protein DedD n=1 Tax=Paraferrimonas sedimenticola TaxID=375674 RepID=A0AA37RWN5_9GAMM|nr:SPOR domain-containing protein [Paraferrimonas sedimenticola]GLP96573.1 cell division protein DedD [Paraferrimonas sedimenticola]